MRLRTICFGIALSFIILFQPRTLSQETKQPKIARLSAAQKDKGTTHKVTKPKIESGHYPVKSSRTSETHDPDPKGHEAEAAEQFMQLKADVYADLIRLEDSKDSDPKSRPVRAGDSMMQPAGSETVKHASGGSITELPVQANRAVQAESPGSSKP